MSNHLTLDQLRLLGGYRAASCVSLYFATGVRGADADKRRVEIKNIISALLKMDGDVLPNDCRSKILSISPDEESVGSYGSGSRAYFFSEKFSYKVELASRLKPLVKVNKCFHLVPLFMLWFYEKPHYLMKMSLQHIELYLVTGLRFEKIEFKIPMHLQESYSPDMDEWSLQMFNEIRDVLSNQSREDMVGQGGGARYFGASKTDRHDIADAEIIYFLKHVDQCLMETIDNKSIPLILAADSNVAQLFQDLSQYPLINKDIIRGNPDHIAQRDLHQKTFELIRQNVDQHSQKFLHEFANLQGSPQGIAIDDLDKIEIAAQAGVIKTLLIDRKNGPVDSDFPSQILRHPNQIVATDQGEKLNRIITQTLTHGGQILWFRHGMIPTKSPAAAVLHAAL